MIATVVALLAAAIAARAEDLADTVNAVKALAMAAAGGRGNHSFAVDGRQDDEDYRGATSGTSFQASTIGPFHKGFDWLVQWLTTW